MGWTSIHTRENVLKNNTRRTLCDNLFIYDNSPYEILKSAMVGSTYYAAIKHTEKGDVFAAVILTKTRSIDYYNFSYKDMTEECGPCECKCPISILNLLTPTTNEYAVEWRKRCYRYQESRKLARKLKDCPLGTVAIFSDDSGRRIFKKENYPYWSKRTKWVDWKNRRISTNDYLAMKNPTLIMP